MNRFSSAADRAPALILVAASIILAAGFSLPVGGERASRTQYQRLEGFVGTFSASRAEDSVGKSTAPANGEAWGLVAQAVRQRYTPVQADAILNRVESFGKDKEDQGKRVPRRGRAKTRRPLAVAASVAASTVTVRPDAGAILPVAAPVSEAADSVSERYENNLAKYSLAASAAQGSVTLRLLGLSRDGGRCILKVSVTNRGGDDFFVREFVLRDEQGIIDSKSFIRLFVEPGRAREGFVVFEKPRNGAAVHVALKEDREKGRVVELLVPYPF